MNDKYISYDIKGIQKSIFAVPRLLTIIGGSAMIDGFDNKIESIAESYDGIDKIFAGGGKGILSAASEELAENVIKRLVKEAHAMGLSLRIGNENTLESAMTEANQLYPFIPDNLEGYPCEESGLFPVKNKGVHEIIKNRIELGRVDPVGRKILKFMRVEGLIPEKLKDKNLDFVKSIDKDDPGMGAAGNKLFENSNRWAIIAMDGNDIGRQFRAYKAKEDMSKEHKEIAKNAWTKKVSEKLKECTIKAFAVSLGKILNDMVKEIEFPTYKENGEEYTVLPFRPLILGGDDLLVISHTSVAMPFVRKIVKNFERFTAQEAEEEEKNTGNLLWPASIKEGKLTISAGIVYIGTSYPLHTAIEYADDLLNGAKAEMRVKDAITPSVIDWENITESFIDTPAERRYRELVFNDKDLSARIELTCRPYTIENLEKELIPLTEKIRGSSRSVMTDLLESMKKSWAERVLYLSSFARHEKNKWISKLLDESNPDKLEKKGWIIDRSVRKTMIFDAMLLVEEEHRVKK